MFPVVAQGGSFKLYSYGLYSLIRRIIEFFRYHDPGEMIIGFSPLSLSQVISIAFILSSTFMLFTLKLKTQGGVA